MGSSGGGSANPAYLSQGASPIPNLPIAGQGAPNDNPRNFGSFQEFLPEVAPAGQPGSQILPAGQGPEPLAHGLTAEMFKYRSPQGVAAPTGGGGAVGGAGAAAAAGGGDIEGMKQQIAQLQAQAGNGQFGAARGTGAGSAATAGSPYNNFSGSPTDGPMFNRGY
jgi:hypothetical protein